MIENLTIKHFKSIRSVTIPCKKVNVLIGEPNTGKSNILEALGLFSLPYGRLRDFVRYENLTNLFYDNEITERIEVVTDKWSLEVQYTGQEKFEIKAISSDGGEEDGMFSATYDFRDMSSMSHGRNNPVKFYRFRTVNEFDDHSLDFLLPPHGKNLHDLLMTKRDLRELVSDIFRKYDLRLVLKPQESKIEVQKISENLAISYPYSLISDTIQRLIFHMMAVETNTDSVLIFEEPESHAFPYHTKFLAERIAMDKNTNQFFVSTHNPYFLFSLITKTPSKDIGINIVYYKDHETRARSLNSEHMADILDLDDSVFFELDSFIEGE